MRISLIINTYNHGAIIAKTLSVLAAGTRLPDELIFADDGSTDTTATVLKDAKENTVFNIKHCWQKNQGYRRSRILNEAIKSSVGDYLIFLDADCIPSKQFIADHLTLAERGYFVQGRRAFVAEDSVSSYLNGSSNLFRLLLLGKISGVFKICRFPRPVVRINQSLHGVLGCNLAIWRDDLLCVNGYDESFEGWGKEDSELAARLYHNGLSRKLVHGRAIVYHLNHPIRSRERLEKNQSILEETLAKKKKRCEKGIENTT